MASSCLGRLPRLVSRVPATAMASCSLWTRRLCSSSSSSDGSDIIIRPAIESDVPAIKHCFEEAYKNYPYKQFFQEDWLKSALYSPDITFLAAIDSSHNNAVVGTASILHDYSAQSDLCAEFGRLVVEPQARGKGIANQLMHKRLELASKQIHVAIVENRCVHTRSQAVSRKHGFVCVGFLPEAHLLGQPPRESVSLWAKHFGPALALRSHDARIIPEVAAIAFLALRNCGLPPQPVIDGTSTAYPRTDAASISVSDMAAGKAPHALLRIERGRVREREVFGPVQLHQGFAKLEASHAHYIVARDAASGDMESEPLMGADGPIVSAAGYLYSEEEKKMRIFEVLSVSDRTTRVAMEGLMERAKELGVEYIEVDVSAEAVRMQRTFWELGFVAAAYIPAGAFSSTSRVDVVKFVRLDKPLLTGELCMLPETQELADVVLAQLRPQQVVERITQSMQSLPLFAGATPEQCSALAAAGSIITVPDGDCVYESGDAAMAMYLILDGSVAVYAADKLLGTLTQGQLLAETSFLNETAHEGAARCQGGKPVELLCFQRQQLESLLRRRPDVGMLLYANLARDLGKKLRDANKAND